MKGIKILTVFICLVLVMGFALVPALACNAQEVSYEEDNTDKALPEEAESTRAEEDGISQGGFAYYYGRISESIAAVFDTENLDTLITWCCSVLSVLIVSLLKGSVNKLKNKISGTLDGSTAKTNELIEGYNENSKRIENLEASTHRLYEMLEEKCALDSSVSEKVSAFAEMMFLIYNGSTTIPEGLKDVLRVKYANLAVSCRQVSDDKEGQASV